MVAYENVVSLLAPPPLRGRDGHGSRAVTQRARHPPAERREADRALGAATRAWGPSHAPSNGMRQHTGSQGLVLRPVVRLVGLDKARAREVLVGLVPSGSSREALGLPHGLLTALRRLGVPDVFASAMRAEAESYGSEEVLIDDYLEFVTSFGSATAATADGAVVRAQSGKRYGESSAPLCRVRVFCLSWHCALWFYFYACMPTCPPAYLPACISVSLSLSLSLSRARARARSRSRSPSLFSTISCGRRSLY